MYYLKLSLLKQISNLLGETNASFSNKCFNRQHLWPQRLQAMSRLLVRDIVSICNAYKLPLSTFINQNPTDYAAKEFLQPAHDFKPITIQPQKLYALYNDEIKRTTKQNLCNIFNIAPSTLYFWVTKKDKFDMKAVQLLALCNQLNISPYEIIDDPNRLTNTTAISHETLVPQINILTQQILQQQQTIQQLSENNKQLMEKLKELLENHEEE